MRLRGEAPNQKRSEIALEEKRGTDDVDGRVEIKTPPVPRGNKIWWEWARPPGPLLDLLRKSCWMIYLSD